ncbi:MAG: hypothetical protein IJ092_13895 [Atopobiaceae bacterium]|nr:hypothetical protein [Atopobiaceae bacterium]MBR1830644.1 hypothetical protein [Atopobiaceae bacterium]
MPVDIDVEGLLQQTCWVVDCLPSQVPAVSEGQFFSVENLLIHGPRRVELRHAFATVLLKLNCYHDFLVFRDQRKKAKRNPKPEKLEKWISRNREHLCIALPSEQALIVLPTSSTCMELYHPTPRLLEEMRALATASGLFVWRPNEP